MAGDWVEGIEIHHVLARLAVDPVDRGLDRQPPQVVAEILRLRVETHDRQISADRQQGDPRAVPADIGIELERAREDFDTQKRSRTMADDDDSLGVAAGGNLHEVFCETVDALVPFWL